MERIKVTITGLIADLDEGLNRKAIAEKYNLSMMDIKKIFMHPKLKNLKPRKPVAFELIDDTEDVIKDTKISVDVKNPEEEIIKSEEEENFEIEKEKVPKHVWKN